MTTTYISISDNTLACASRIDLNIPGYTQTQLDGPSTDLNIPGCMQTELDDSQYPMLLFDQ
jgi:hypothetical protein